MSNRDEQCDLMEIEGKILDAVDQAWTAYENNGAGMPPRALMDMLFKAHAVLTQKLKSRVGAGFDPTRPEETLLRIKRYEQMLIEQIDKRKRLQLIVGGRR